MWGNVWFDFKNRFFNRTGRKNALLYVITRFKAE